MSSLHLVDPELRPLLDTLPPLVLTRENLDEVRRHSWAAEADLALPVEVRRLTVPGPAGAPPVGMLAYRPRAAAAILPAVFHIHGGGYVSGRADVSDAANRQLAVELGCAVYSVDYRLAPETPYPGPVEDCYAALAWLFAHAAAEGVDPARIAIKGESAGGGLSAATALVARDRGEVGLAFQFLGCPMLDDRTAVRTDISPLLGEFIWTHANNAFGWRAMLPMPPGSADVPAHAAPARETDLAGLPPTFINVGALDLLLEEGVAYAHRLAAAGVPVELHVYPGCFHGFELVAQATVTRRAFRDGIEALRRALAL